MSIKFGAAIILYNPTFNQIENIKKYVAHFDKVFIFDNSEPIFEKKYEFDENFEYFTENSNKGLPYAFNRILQTSSCKELNFLCTLDQDSIFKEKEINNIKNKICSLRETSDIGIIAPYIDYGFEKISYKDEFVKKKWVITSGSFINLDILYKEKFKFDENYFIDKFEIDMCQQYISKNYNVYMYLNSTLHQRLGETSGHKHPNHSALRHYYLFRNRFYFNNKWYGGLKKYTLNFLQTLKHIVLILLYEEKKIEKVKILKQAIKDFQDNKMGKYNTTIQRRKKN